MVHGTSARNNLFPVPLQIKMQIHVRRWPHLYTWSLCVVCCSTWFGIFIGSPFLSELNTRSQHLLTVTLMKLFLPSCHLPGTLTQLLAVPFCQSQIEWLKSFSKYLGSIWNPLAMLFQLSGIPPPPLPPPPPPPPPNCVKFACFWSAAISFPFILHVKPQSLPVLKIIAHLHFPLICFCSWTCPVLSIVSTFVCVYVCVCVSLCVHACLHACVWTCLLFINFFCFYVNFSCTLWLLFPHAFVHRYKDAWVLRCTLKVKFIIIMMHACVSLCVCVWDCVHVYMCACVCVHVGVCSCMCGWPVSNDNVFISGLSSILSYVTRSDKRVTLLTQCQFGHSELLIHAPTESAIKELKIWQVSKLCIITKWSKLVEEWPFRENEDERIYTASVKVSICNLICVLKSFMGPNGLWAVRIWNRHPTVWKNQNNKLI